MEQERRLGRGLEDFSHLFLSPTATDVDDRVAADRQGDDRRQRRREQGASASPPVICITADRKVKERLSLTLNLALAIARRGKRVLLLDADFDHPRLWMLAGSPENGSILGVISANGDGPSTGECADGVRLITLDVDVSSLDCLDASKSASVTSWFTTAEKEADIVLAAASPSLSRPTIAILKSSRDIVVVTPRNPSDMVNAYGVIKTVAQVNGEARVGIVASGISGPDECEVVFGKMQKTVSEFLGKPLHNYGHIPADKQISLPRAKRKPISLRALPAETVRCVAGISQAILQMNGERAEDGQEAAMCCSLTERLFRTARHASTISP